MANIFNIKLTAVDNATKVVNKVNKSVAKVFEPYDKAKQSAKSFLGAIGKNDLIKRTSSSFESLGGSIAKIGAQFGVAEESMMGGALSLGTRLMSMGGPIGAIAGTAAIAGVAIEAMGVKAGKSGLDIARTARGIGITTDQLQEYRGAAKMVGLSTDAMDSSLSTLSGTLQDAGAGRNAQAAATLSQMGISISRNSDGVVDTVKAYRDLSDVISRIADPNIQKKLADMFGMSEMLPLSREGTAALDGYINNARKLGLVQSKDVVESNEQAGQSWNRLKAAVDGMGTSLGNLIAQYAHTDKIADWVNGLAKPLAQKANEKHELNVQDSRGIHTPVDKLIAQNSDVYTTPFMRQWRADRSPAMGAEGAQASSDGAPIGIRNNNPGNLRSWAGAGSNGGYASFPTAGDGLTAAAKNLLAYQDKYGINTINGIVNRWAPAADHNDVPSYVQDLSKNTGFGANQGLNLHDPAQLAPLLSSMVKHENGQNPFSADEIGKAVAQALKDNQANASVNLKVEGLPQGLSIKAVRGLGQVNTGLALAPGGAS